VDGVDDQWQGLVAYGTSLADAAYSTASYVDRILHGAQPGDLPVESVTRQTLIVNLETARKIGVTIPSEVIERADQVIPAKE
jgi:putative ABC transport system substrate-binding protein